MTTAILRKGLARIAHYINPRICWQTTFIMCLVCSVISAATAVIITASLWKIDVAEITASYDARIEELRESARKDLASLEREKDAIIAQCKSANDSLFNDLTSVTEKLKSLETAYAFITAPRQVEYDKLSEFWYVFKSAGAGSGLTVNLVQYAIEQCEDFNLNPHLLWNTLLVESDVTINTKYEGKPFVEKAAKILPSTGKYLWEDVLRNRKGSFNAEMLSDPYLRIRLAAAHLGKDISDGRSVTYAVDHYFGGNGLARSQQIIRKAISFGIRLDDSNAYFAA